MSTGEAPRRPADTWYLTRFLLLRWLGFVYAVAFLIAARQIVPLIGDHGLTPASEWMAMVRDYFQHQGASPFWKVPSLFWFGLSDRLLVVGAWTGFALSLVVVAGYANSIIMLVLWAGYMSYVHIGQIWYSYGWEIQTLETGFLAIFLCPLLDPRPFSRRPPPIVILWLYRWLGFRIMLGAGLIKMRGDPCWRDLTCLYYHYQTQPLPNPLSRYLEFAPHWFQKFGVLWNDFIELIVPWFCFWPRPCRRVAGLLMISFQFILIASGNLAFLNWLTIVP
ncbi:MAG TPA: lipase maturation factor family protein, partial [Chthoniobacteraceae bacterium]|nr:lipase maturation factor family protein [Chthoniobacteraceae bacterium]